MNLKRFIGRNTRDAMQKVRLAYGDNAVVLSTKPCSEGVEVLAMAPETVNALERFGDSGTAPQTAGMLPQQQPSLAQQQAAAGAIAQRVQGAAASMQQPRPGDFAAHAASMPAGRAAAAASAPTTVQDDVGTLAMSTLSFQDYVRERMLKKRQAELQGKPAQPVPASPQAIEQRLMQREQQAAAMQMHAQAQMPARAPQMAQDSSHLQLQSMQMGLQSAQMPMHTNQAPFDSHQAAGLTHGQMLRTHRPTTLGQPTFDQANLGIGQGRMNGLDEIDLTVESLYAPYSRATSQPRQPEPMAAPARAAEPAVTTMSDLHDAVQQTVHRPIAEVTQKQGEMMRELREMKGLIEERFGAMAFMERLQKNPKQLQLISRLVECGFSPALVRKLAEGLPEGTEDEMAWAATTLQRYLITDENDAGIDETGGIFAMIGSTGVGKTTTTAKLAASFATRHGAHNLGLITLDAYRVGAHEQLRAYGRILGVPVHTAHDRVALEDLLDLLSNKRMVLIDTAGLGQRDTRTRELLDMISHRSIERLVVVNAAQQGETIEDVLESYKAPLARGIVLSKMDEAVKLGPALDAVIRNRLKVVGVANGQRVPEDWHRLTAQALVQRSLHCSGNQAWRMDAQDVSLMFASANVMPARQSGARPGPVQAAAF